MNRIRFFHFLIPDAGTRPSGKSTEDYDGELSKWEHILETSFPPGKVDAISSRKSGFSNYVINFGEE